MKRILIFCAGVVMILIASSAGALEDLTCDGLAKTPDDRMGHATFPISDSLLARITLRCNGDTFATTSFGNTSNTLEVITDIEAPSAISSGISKTATYILDKFEKGDIIKDSWRSSINGADGIDQVELVILITPVITK